MAQFRDMARQLTQTISQSLKIDAPIPSTREPEPCESVAWSYVTTYYDRDPDAVFSIVDRHDFEMKLHAHFGALKVGDSSLDGDPGWYALRNAIYAAGCRAQAVEAQSPASDMLLARSWSYFLNALSKHTEVMYSRATLSAVQALTVMVSSPQCSDSTTLTCRRASLWKELALRRWIICCVSTQ